MGCLKLTYQPQMQVLRTRKPKLSHEPKVVQWFLSVDPLAEKYPSISPYAYVANNPINAIDPNGREIILLSKNLLHTMNIIANTRMGYNLFNNFANSSQNHLFIREGDVAGENSHGFTLNIKVSQKTVITEKNYMNLLKKNAKREGYNFNKVDKKTQKFVTDYMKSFIGTELKEGVNSLITVDPTEAVGNLGDYGGIETVFHEPFQHANDNGKSGNQEHREAANTPNGVYWTNGQSDGTPMEEFLMQVMSFAPRAEEGTSINDISNWHHDTTVLQYDENNGNVTINQNSTISQYYSNEQN